MNAALQTVVAASTAERRDLFLSAATRVGTTLEYIEKDFWVCWTLDALFNGLGDRPRLLFKGGTSLSKAFNLISRFSEDIDITVFRDDLGESGGVADLEALSNKQRQAKLDAIKLACQHYIGEALIPQLRALVNGAMAAGSVPAGRFSVEPDASDPDAQSVLFSYPAVGDAAVNAYVQASVRIESGAKSALDPNETRVILPYISEDLPHLDLRVANVTTVLPDRTFWDKVMILHGLRQWYEQKAALRHGGQRVSRHYYDVYSMLQAPEAKGWTNDRALAEDCRKHAGLFFGSAALGLDKAKPGQFTLAPSEPMRDALDADYTAMQGMIFGAVPRLEDILEHVVRLETRLNAG